MNNGGRAHIVKSYQQELDYLRTLMADMGKQVDQQFDLAMRAILDGDNEAANEATAMDRDVDEMEREVESLAIRLLALRSPFGADLRETIAALKITDGLERMGDYAASIARRSRSVGETKGKISLSGLRSMGSLVQENLRMMIHAMKTQDTNEALALWHADDAVDESYTTFFRELVTYMIEEPRNIRPCTELLFIAKNLERIGDHASNIAERIFYAATGTSLLHQRRPKAAWNHKQKSSEELETEHHEENENGNEDDQKV
ncbi:phosphate signaling complex protein PhoU [Acetobacteraceae bacterium]|nr:phosphate signaling complex protein PhoU [Acetobacteraceae bacterium]